MANGLQGLHDMGMSCDNCILPKLTHYYLPVFKMDYTGSTRSSDSRLWKFSVYRVPNIDLYVNSIGLESRHY